MRLNRLCWLFLCTLNKAEGAFVSLRITVSLNGLRFLAQSEKTKGVLVCVNGT